MYYWIQAGGGGECVFVCGEISVLMDLAKDPSLTSNHSKHTHTHTHAVATPLHSRPLFLMWDLARELFS